MKKLFFISMFLAFSLTCFAQKGKWEKAQRKNTIESYQEFLKKYPNSEFSNDAILKLMGLEYKKAENVNSIGIYSSFIDTYGKNKNSYSEQAKNKLIQLEFDYAKKKNSVDAFEQFIQKYSDEKYYVDKARTSVAEIEFN